MSYRDDDKYDDDDAFYDDDDFDDDDDEELGASVNPFTTGGSRPASNLPGRDRFSGGDTSRAGGGGASRFGAPSSRSESSDRPTKSTSAPPSRDTRSPGSDPRRSLLSGDSEKEDDKGGASRFGGGVSRSGRGTGPLRGGGTTDDDKGGSSRFGGGVSRFGAGDRKDDDKDSSSRFSRGGTGSLGRSDSEKDDDKGGASRFGGGVARSDRGTGPSRGSGTKDDDKGGTSRFGGGVARSDRATGPLRGSGTKDDDGGRGGGHSGVASRFSRGGKRDDAEDKGGGRLGATSRFGRGGKKDDADNKGGGLFSRGGKKDDRSDVDRKTAAASAGAGALGGIRSRFGRGGKDDKPSSSRDSGASRLGSIRSRLGRGGDSADQPAGRRPAAREEKGSRFGSVKSPLRRGGRDASDQKQSAFGRASDRTATTTDDSRDRKDRESTGGGLFGRLRGGGKKEARTPRPSRTPRVAGEGLSLDNKLDIVGVALFFGALVIMFSALSPNQALITGLLNFLGELFGWGAIAIPGAMFLIGLWLIVRHFGDDAPTVDPVRLIGVVMAYVGALVLFQYLDSFGYAEVRDLPSLEFRLQQSYKFFHAGGGLLGAQLYLLMVTNFTEIGGFFMMAGWLVVSVMFMARLSASELAFMIISVWRSFRTAQHRRSARRRAQAQLAAQQATALAPTDISVARPDLQSLPGGTAAALPAGPVGQVPTPIEERNIPIRMGGQMIATSLTPEEELDSLPAAVVAPQTAAALTQAEPQGNGGRFSRFRRGSEDESPTEAQPPAATTGRGGLFGRSSTEEPAVEKTQPAVEAQPATSRGGRLFGRSGKPETGPDSTEQPTLPLTPEPAARATESVPTMGQLLGQPTAPSGTKPAVASPFDPPAQGDAPEPTFWDAGDVAKQATTEMPPEDDMLSRMPPAQPKREGPAPRPERSSRFGIGVMGKPKDKDEATSDTEQPKPALSDRMSRLDEIRKGRGTRPMTPAASTAGTGTDANLERPVEEEETQPATTAASSTGRVRSFGDMSGASKPAVTPFARPAPGGSEREKPSAIDKEEAPAASVAAAARPASITSSPVFQRPSTPPSASATPVSRPAATPAGSGRLTSRSSKKNWRLPDYRTLLGMGSDQDLDHESLVERARTIEDTLQSFGAPGKVVEINTGPVITQFGVEPDYLLARSGKKSRVKVGAIAQLDKDLQLSLGAKAIRIEAPVPGKGYVGIEVPNDVPALVSLRDVMDSDEFKKIDSPLTIALGQGVDGTPVAADLRAMPHLLIAGTTGSGKSVCVNSIINCLLMVNTPDKVKFIMVDPKRVELTSYNGLPHLVAPVVVELERIVGVLKWVTREMDERYKRFSNAGARNIEDFNKHLPDGEEWMPYIVVMIDELADLMMLAPDETERVITRIAALARATGIHLVISTQRPSVDVVTGLIKANFPSRVAFAVAGGVDSRVILDQPGAERLLGRGDMLYMSGDSPAPLRLQGVFVSDDEINNITQYWRTQDREASAPPPVASVKFERAVPTGEARQATPADPGVQKAFWDDDSGGSDSTNGKESQEDELYEEAVDMVRRLNKASVSLLQRRLRIGYTRAARLIDMMEEQGVVGPPTEGSKPRKVLPVKE